MEEPLVPTTVEEYRKGKTKIVKLASGKVFEIRKMPLTVMADLLTILGLDLPKGTPVDQIEALMKEKTSNPEFKIKIIDAVNATIPRCVIQPKISENASIDSLSLDDIAPEDLFELFEQISEFSGLTRLAAKAREKFRE